MDIGHRLPGLKGTSIDPYVWGLIWGFPKIRGCSLGVYNKDHRILGVLWLLKRISLIAFKRGGPVVQILVAKLGAHLDIRN